MNIVEAYSMLSPNGRDEECAKFTIDTPENAYILADVMVVGRTYTYSCWLRSDTNGTVMVSAGSFSSTAEWTYITHTFSADQAYLDIAFSTPSTYYIYHPQLEMGNRATDWTPAPEDVDTDISEAHDTARNAQDAADGTAERLNYAESTIQQLVNNISMLVVDENGQSLMSQTSDGWMFSTAAIEDQVRATSDSLAELVEKMGSTEVAIDKLSNSVDEFGVIAEYVHIGSYTYTDETGIEQTEPSIDLFETDTGFKLKITNTRIVFVDGTTELLTVNSKTQSLSAPKVIVSDELEVGGNNYVNLVPRSIDTDGSIYNSCGYMDGYTLDPETGAIQESETEAVTGYIPIEYGKLYTNGFDWLSTPNGGRICVYDATFNFIDAWTDNLRRDELNGFNLVAILETLGTTTYAYIRASGLASGSKFLLTLDEKPTGSWIWKQRANGNLGLIWKEAT